MKHQKLISADIWRDDLVQIARSPEIWLYALLVVLAPSITFVSLRALGSIVPGAGVILTLLFVWQYRRVPSFSLPIVSMWLAFMAMVVIAALEAPNADDAWDRLTKLAMFSFSALLIWTSARQSEGLAPLKTVMVGIMVIAILFGLMEGLTGGWFFWLTHDVGYGDAALAANRPMIVLALMIWPLMLVLAERSGALSAAAAFLGLLLASFSAESQASQVGLLLGMVVLLFALTWPRATGWTCLVGGVVAILGMPFFFAYVDLGGFFGQSTVAQTTVLPRLELWAFVSEQVIAQFPFGHGLEAGRSLSLADMEQRYFEGVLMHHPHNGVLQIWLEFGLIGALAAACAWALLLNQCFQMERWQAAVFLACASCFLLIGSVSHGMWQSWWVSALALLPFLFVVATSPERQ